MGCLASENWDWLNHVVKGLKENQPTQTTTTTPCCGSPWDPLLTRQTSFWPLEEELCEGVRFGCQASREHQRNQAQLAGLHALEATAPVPPAPR